MRFATQKGTPGTWEVFPLMGNTSHVPGVPFGVAKCIIYPYQILLIYLHDLLQGDPRVCACARPP